MMKNVKMFAGICVLTLCVASTTLAGDIFGPGIIPPPPPPPTQQAVAQTSSSTSDTTDVSEPTLLDTLIATTLSLIMTGY